MVAQINMATGPEFIIVESEDGRTFTAYAEKGQKLCSDTNYQDCLLKVGLIYGIKMEPVSPNSWAAERIMEQIERYG